MPLRAAQCPGSEYRQPCPRADASRLELQRRRRTRFAPRPARLPTTGIEENSAKTFRPAVLVSREDTLGQRFRLDHFRQPSALSWRADVVEHPAGAPTRSGAAAGMACSTPPAPAVATSHASRRRGHKRGELVRRSVAPALCPPGTPAPIPTPCAVTRWRAISAPRRGPASDRTVPPPAHGAEISAGVTRWHLPAHATALPRHEHTRSPHDDARLTDCPLHGDLCAANQAGSQGLRQRPRRQQEPAGCSCCAERIRPHTPATGRTRGVCLLAAPGGR